jgi:hypothetical protein
MADDLLFEFDPGETRKALKDALDTMLRLNLNYAPLERTATTGERVTFYLVRNSSGGVKLTPKLQ